MPKPDVFITFRVTQDEKELLKKYCFQEVRNQTEVLRELIRGLRRRLKRTDPKGSPDSSHD